MYVEVVNGESCVRWWRWEWYLRGIGLNALIEVLQAGSNCCERGSRGPSARAVVHEYCTKKSSRTRHIRGVKQIETKAVELEENSAQRIQPGQRNRANRVRAPFTSVFEAV